MKLLDVQHLTRPGLADISFSLAPAELVCLGGVSGAGKSLLLRALADLDVNEGQVFLDGRERASFRPAEWRRQVGLLPAESRWWAPTVGAHFDGREPPWLAELGFGPEVLSWQVERLSSGERQRLALARLLDNRPRVLLLDEPTANLDADNARRVEGLIRDYIDREQAACLWVTHAVAQAARIADRRLLIEGGMLSVEQAA